MNNINLNHSNIRFKSVPQQELQQEQVAPVAQNERYVEIPQIYENISSQKPTAFTEKVKKVDAMGMVYPFIEHPLLGAATAFTLIKGVDAYSNACGGEYEKSILGRATALGDRIATSNFWDKKVPKKVLNWTTTGYSKFKNVLNKNSWYRAMKYTPAIAEWSMPKSELISQEVRFMHEFSEIMDVFFDNKSGLKLKDVGIDKTEAEALKKFFNVSSISKVDTHKAAHWTVLKRLNIPDDEIKNIIDSNNALEQVQEKLRNVLKLTAEEITDIKKNPELPENISKVKEVSQRVRGQVKIGKGHYGFDNTVGLFHQIFERRMGLDQVANRMHSIGEGAKTGLGKFFANALHKIHRGFTFGGGKLGMLLFIVPHMVLGLSNIKKAEKDEIVGTTAKGLIDPVSWVFTFPLSFVATYALGGLQNIGMSEDQVKQCRDLVKNFNETTFADKKSYDSALKTLKGQLKDLRKVKDQNLLTKITRGITKFFYSDLGMIKPFQNGKFYEGLGRSLKNKLRNITCVPIRFILCMFGFQTLFTKLIEKGTTLAFGKHYDEEKELEYESKKEEQEKFTKEDLKTRLYEAQREKVYGVNSTEEFKVPENLEKRIMEEQYLKEIEKRQKEEAKKPLNTAVPVVENKPTVEENPITEDKVTQESEKEIAETALPATAGKEMNKYDNYTYIPSSESKIEVKQKTEKDTYKYIPSQIGKVAAKTFDNSGLQEALRRADKAEQRAIQVLSGKFNPY